MAGTKFFRGASCRRDECAGLMVASFGAGLIAARIMPYSLIIIVAAAALIVMGLLICKK